MTDAIDLTTEQRNMLSDLLRRFLPGVVVWAYGSRVKWTARPNSDLDLVTFTAPEQRAQVADLREALAESNLPFPVDLHVWDDVPERFREIIRKEYVVVQEAKEPESGSGIADGWNSCTIGDLCDAGIVELQTGPFGTQLHAHDYVEDGVPVVPTEAIRNRQIDHSVLPKVASGKAEELARHRLERGDILFARRGVQATGHIGCVREAEEGFLCGTGAIRLRVREGGRSVNPDFLSHVLANPASVEWFKFHAIGATMPNLNEGIIRSFPLQIPPMAEQRAVAHILGTLDDKIELNRKMNETLEAMARGLFKSWFVDFLPVRAKMAAKSNDYSLLLPQAEPNTWFVYAIECNDDSLYIGQTEDLRQRWLQHVGGRGGSWTKQHPPVRVPYWEKQPSREAAVERERWLKTGFGRKWLKKEIAARTQTGDPVRAKATGRDTGLPQHLADLFPDSFEDSELGEIPRGWGITQLDDLANIQGGKQLPTEECKPLGQIPVFGANGIMGCAERSTHNGFVIAFGRVGAYCGSVHWTYGGAWINNNASSVVPKRWPEFVLQAMLIANFERMRTGSAQPFIPNSSLVSLQIVRAPDKVLDEFCSVVKALRLREQASKSESRLLASLRDTLLPKLISGEVRVKSQSHEAKSEAIV